MALSVKQVDVWAISLEDRVGSLAEKLLPLAAAGANLELVLARGAPEHPGRGVVFVSPLKGAAQVKTAEKVGFLKTQNLHTLRAEGPDKPGFGEKLTKALAAAKIDLRGVVALTIGKRFVVYLAFDGKDELTKAARILRKL
jgi:hypothetical protein